MAPGYKTGGRKRGSRNKARLEDREAARKGGILPLEHMLKVMRDESVDLPVRNDMAKAAAPYLHAKVTEDMVSSVSVDSSPRTIVIQGIESRRTLEAEGGPPNAPQKLLEGRIEASAKHLMPEYRAENVGSSNGNGNGNGNKRRVWITPFYGAPYWREE